MDCVELGVGFGPQDKEIDKREPITFTNPGYSRGKGKKRH